MNVCVCDRGCVFMFCCVFESECMFVCACVFCLNLHA